jgi:hypothetical protein
MLQGAVLLLLLLLLLKALFNTCVCLRLGHKRWGRPRSRHGRGRSSSARDRRPPREILAQVRPLVLQQALAVVVEEGGARPGEGVARGPVAQAGEHPLCEVDGPRPAVRVAGGLVGQEAPPAHDLPVEAEEVQGRVVAAGAEGGSTTLVSCLKGRGGVLRSLQSEGRGMRTGHTAMLHVVVLQATGLASDDSVL